MRAIIVLGIALVVTGCATTTRDDVKASHISEPTWYTNHSSDDHSSSAAPDQDSDEIQSIDEEHSANADVDITQVVF